ncbi:glucosyltransferase domain-containing protein [Psychrobacillus sp. FSL K6-1464]|uniref:glucosyltransferase domain-containing protein n=1 Tax=Psychrobacillus sp. FSL K6-1464 TaxID=2921545 RepID=UPI0030F73796
MPEQILEKFKTWLRPEWKSAFIASVVIGFLIHLYAFVNYLPNHDGLINIHNTQLKFKLGRFFLGPFSGISSFFDLPFVIGVMSIFYLAITVVLIVEILKLRKTLSIWLTAGLVVSFPTVASTFSYMFTADGYMMGFLLAALAVLVTQKFKYGFIAGALIFYLSVGIYQANLPFALTLIALVWLQDLLFGNRKIKVMVYKWTSYVWTIGIGMILYAITFKTYQTYFAGEITDYQGLSEIGAGSLNLLSAFVAIKDSMLNFFFGGFQADIPMTFMDVLNIVLVFITIAGLIWALRRLSIGHIVLVVGVFVMMPVLSYCMYFVSPGVEYHMLMVMGLVSFYILPILFYDQMISEKRFGQGIAWSTVIVLGLTVFNFGLIANISYFNTTLKYEKSISYANRVLDRMEQTDGYENVTKLAIFGTYYLKSELGSSTIPDKLPSMTGVIGETILAQPYHYQYLFANEFGESFHLASELEKNTIQDSEWFEEMPTWPHPDSIRVKGDIIVIKLNK